MIDLFHHAVDVFAAFTIIAASLVASAYVAGFVAMAAIKQIGALGLILEFILHRKAFRRWQEEQKSKP